MLFTAQYPNGNHQSFQKVIKKTNQSLKRKKNLFKSTNQKWAKTIEFATGKLFQYLKLEERMVTEQDPIESNW